MSNKLLVYHINQEAEWETLSVGLAELALKYTLEMVPVQNTNQMDEECSFLLLYHIRRQSDFEKLIDFYKGLRYGKSIFGKKIIIIWHKKNPTWENQCLKMGLTDQLEPSMSSKKISFKLDIWIKSLLRRTPIDEQIYIEVKDKPSDFEQERHEQLCLKIKQPLSVEFYLEKDYLNVKCDFHDFCEGEIVLRCERQYFVAGDMVILKIKEKRSGKVTEYNLNFEIRENSIEVDEIYYSGYLQQESISIFNKYLELIQERQNQISDFLNFVKGIA